ncbi:L-lactate dehydrogenase [Agromyces rhizosphaerae]|uniref:L-lactate dehydrogenase n=1 Tax=Agromyces rhizosphaerae TaxID=88374 RepID=A0A9W6CZA4_9MICO|nr:L-lactate dehydrogenase [Agromyces rhizosphaerae]GLI28731.1 L-lactate dehydrogenase [Agromyces rhizosphaerae]
MAVIENSKLSVIGAGAVGASVALSALVRGSAREVALYDIDRKKAEAEVLDLAHGTLFAGSSTIAGGDDLDVVTGSNMVIITAGAKQRPGQTRLDLAGANINIMKSLMPQLLDRAPDAVYMLVTNPCDVLTVAAQKITGLPSSRVFSSGTVLDSSRLRWLIAQRADVASSSVHAMIVGEHGDSEFPLWSHATIGPVPIRDWADAQSAVKPELGDFDAIADEVRTAAYQIIEGKGATNHAIGLSAARIAEAVLDDQRAVLPVSSVLDDYLGESGVALSVPSIVDSSGVADVLRIPFDDDEAAKFAASAKVIRDSLQTLGF